MYERLHLRDVVLSPACAFYVNRRREPIMYDRNLGKLAKVRAMWRELRRREREGHIPATRALLEIVRLRRRNGVSPMYYLLAGLYRRDLSWEDKVAYLGPERLEQDLNRINPPSTQYLVRNKIASHGILTTFGIPTPPFYGLIGRATGTSAAAAVLRGPDDLLDIMDTHGTDTVCFKNVSGTRGRGFYKVVIDRTNAIPTARILPKGETMALAELWKQLADAPLFDGYFCQGVVEQHPDVARYNPTSLNTARCWMVKDENGEWFMYNAALRIGVGETAIDNFAEGGLGAPINVDTGVLGNATRQTIDRQALSTHPITGIRFSGQRLPMWDIAVDLCKRTAALFPYELVAVDVGFGVDTPVIIELGATPDDHQTKAGRGFGPMVEQLLARRQS